MEARVVDEVLGGVSLEGHEPLEVLPPQDLLGEVGRARLGSHAWAGETWIFRCEVLQLLIDVLAQNNRRSFTILKLHNNSKNRLK